ncbi:MAG: polysaccharide biosynthesis tyrosine autokinase [Bacteroidales bacterium]|nr:polysaccharide biosynthesis tyrosine autokinase [Bacteroidales bacterium]
MSSTQNRKDYIDLNAIVRVCLKKWYFFVIAVALCVGVALIYMSSHDPEYIVKANMLVSEPDDGLSASPLGSIFGQSSNVNDELYSISSHTVLMDVARELGLDRRHVVKDGLLHRKFAYRDYPVDVVFNPTIPDTLRTTLTFKVKVSKDGLVNATVKNSLDELVGEIEKAKFPAVINTPYGKYTLVTTKYFEPGETLKTNIILKGYDAVAEDLAEDITIDVASRKANIISLDMKSSEITYARNVLDCIIDEYNKRALGMTNIQNQQTLDFLNSRLELLSSDLTEVEGDLQNLKSNQGIADLRAEVEYQFTKKGNLESGLLLAETRYEVGKMVRDFISDPANAHNMVPSGLVSHSQGEEATGNAITRYNELLLHRMRLEQTAGPDNKAIQDIDRQLEALRANLIITLDKTLESSALTLKELRSKYNAAQSALSNVPGQERAYRDVVRQQSIKEQLYVHLLKQREAVSMMLANSRAKGVVIDEAFAQSEPEGMSNKVILAVSLMIGLLLGALAVYMQQLFRNKFSDRQELDALTDAPVLGEMCVSHRNESLVVREGGSSTAAELFRLIRTNLLFVLGNDNGSKVVLMTSTRPGEGKSFIAINLASSLALLGKRVLLMGLDIRSPKLAEYLGIPATPGFTEYIASDRYSLDQVIRPLPGAKGLDVMVSGPVPPNPAELLSDHRVDQLFDKLRTMYDFIIVDSAPVGVISDTFALARVSDATVYVCRANYTTKSDIRYFNSLYDTDRLKKVALVINGTAAKQGYGYGAKS